MDLNNQEQPWYKRLWFIITASVIAMIILVGAIIGIIFAVTGNNDDNSGKGEHYHSVDIPLTDNSQHIDLYKEIINEHEEDGETLTTTSTFTGDVTLDLVASYSPADKYEYANVVLYVENFKWEIETTDSSGNLVWEVVQSFGQLLIDKNHLASPNEIDYVENVSNTFFTDYKVSTHYADVDGKGTEAYDVEEFGYGYAGSSNAFDISGATIDYISTAHVENEFSIDNSVEVYTVDSSGNKVYLQNEDESFANRLWLEVEVIDVDGKPINNSYDSEYDEDFGQLVSETINADNAFDYVVYGYSYFVNGYDYKTF